MQASQVYKCTLAKSWVLFLPVHDYFWGPYIKNRREFTQPIIKKPVAFSRGFQRSTLSPHVDGHSASRALLPVLQLQCYSCRDITFISLTSCTRSNTRNFIFPFSQNSSFGEEGRVTPTFKRKAQNLILSLTFYLLALRDWYYPYPKLSPSLSTPPPPPRAFGDGFYQEGFD